MAHKKAFRGAGLAGAALAGGVAGWAAINRLAVHRSHRTPDTVPRAALEMPPGITEHKLVAADGWTIRVVERGPRDGTPVVLLHGITLSATIWSLQLTALADAGFRVLAVDLRGHGGSLPPGAVDLDDAADKAPRSRLTLSRLAGDVEQVLDDLDLRRAILVGHSMGGMVALLMMARDRATRTGRGRVAGLLLVSTTANATSRRGIPGISEVIALTRPVIARGAGLAARLPGPTLPANDLAFLLARVTFGNSSSANQVHFTGEMASAVPARVSAELLLQILRFDEEPRLHRIHLPVTVVVGDHDLMTPVAQSELMAAEIPRAELVVLAGCGHMVMLERPEEFNAAITALANRCSTGAPARAVGE